MKLLSTTLLIALLPACKGKRGERAESAPPPPTNASAPAGADAASVVATPADARIVLAPANPGGQPFALSHLPEVTGYLRFQDLTLVVEAPANPSVRGWKLGDQAAPADAIAFVGALAIADVFAPLGQVKVETGLTLGVELHDGKLVVVPLPALEWSRASLTTALRAAITGGGALALPPRTGKPSTLFWWTTPIVVGPAKLVRDLDRVAFRDEAGFEMSARQCGPYDRVPGKVPLRRGKVTITVRELRSGAVAATHEMIAEDRCGAIANQGADGSWYTQQLVDDAAVTAYLKTLPP